MAMNLRQPGGLLKLIIVSMAVFAGTVAIAGDVLVSFSNNEKITAEELDDYVDKRVDLKRLMRSVFGVESIAKEMAMTRALVLEGQALGIAAADGRKIERFDDVYSLGVYKKLTDACIGPKSIEEERVFFDKTPEAFRAPAVARLKRIMFPVNELIEKKMAADVLMEWVRALNAHTANFDELAQKAEKYYSLDLQGDLGWVNLAEDLPIMKSLSSMKQGELLGPVKEDGYVYLFLITAKHDGRQLRWDEIATEVPQRAIQYCRENEKNKLTSKIFLKYGIVIHKDEINGMSSKNRN